MNKSIFLLSILMLAGSLTYAQEQNNNQKYLRAEELRRAYNFREATDIYRELISEARDTAFIKTLTIQIARSENGSGMLEYASRPIPQGRANAPRADFFHYVPGLEDGSWTPVPESFGKSRSGFIPNNALFYREGADTLYFSAYRKAGNYDIFRIIKGEDNTWLSPEPLSSFINSPGDEILPILSRDGKELYFASNGQYGAGGFDLYVSRFDQKKGEWGIPQNLGFPYSSPADDFLFINSLDKEFSILVSNRDNATADSVRIYRLEFELTPVKSAIGSAAEAARIARLIPESEEKAQMAANAATPGNAGVKTVPEAGDYSSLVKEVRKIQRQIDSTLKATGIARNKFLSMSNSADRSSLEREITNAEISITEMQEKLRMAGKAVQEREMEFLSKGVIIPREEEKQEVQIIIEEPVMLTAFDIEKRSAGKLPFTEVKIPEKPFDYSFRIDKATEVIPDEPAAAGLVYRIQLAVSSSKSQNAAFKGINPVYEQKTRTGKWLYTAGNFNTYDEVSKTLSEVKKLGFRGAHALAYMDGKSIGVKEARLLEEKISENVTFQVKITGHPEGLPQKLLDAAREATNKDIARRIASGKAIFYIGPLSTKAEAEKVFTALTEAGALGATLEEIKRDQE